MSLIAHERQKEKLKALGKDFHSYTEAQGLAYIEAGKMVRQKPYTAAHVHTNQ